MLTASIETNLDHIKRLLEEPDDLIIRNFAVLNSPHKCAIVYIEGLVDDTYVRNNIIEKIQQVTKKKSKFLTVVNFFLRN
ncbi:hypothetical protein JCM21714_1391 [Gracilibacillus boraciitolerans JCM 21714]|uniref:Uncharacterized protein n=1 Tax=Gracilibacillus boraciitolerans JCM 21714 TaxID=1298598 RepID=W4VGQ3_9BACI|nr:hypothetical protein JCM21714_1391 [Gracilibacillus boraciitolerans JCM 21714]